MRSGLGLPLALSTWPPSVTVMCAWPRQHKGNSTSPLLHTCLTQLPPFPPPRPLTPHPEKAAQVLKGVLRTACRHQLPSHPGACGGGLPTPLALHCSCRARPAVRAGGTACRARNTGCLCPHQQPRTVPAPQTLPWLCVHSRHNLAQPINEAPSLPQFLNFPRANVKCIQLHSPRFEKGKLTSLLIHDY